MISVTAPALVHAQHLTAELAAAGFTDASVALTTADVGQVLVDGVPDDARAQVEQIVAAHVPPASPEVEFRKALEAATTVAQIRDALLGKVGPGAQPRAR